MIEVIFLLICGFGAAALCYWLWKSSAKWYNWVLAVSLYTWIFLGISFVYINSIGYHHQAATRGGIFFGIIALAGAFVVARTMGLIGRKARA